MNKRRIWEGLDVRPKSQRTLGGKPTSPLPNYMKALRAKRLAKQKAEEPPPSPAAKQTSDGAKGGTKRDAARIIKRRGGGERKKKRKTNARDLRLASDWEDWQELSGCKVTFPVPTDLSHFFVKVTPTKGYWKGASYEFEVKVPLEYPHVAPQVELITKPIYHPNINFEGRICLNVLREGWQPVMSVAREVIFGLIILFESPNPSDPLPNGLDNGEYEAANLLRKDSDAFKKMVRRTLEGGVFRELEGQTFPELIKGKKKQHGGYNSGYC